MFVLCGSAVITGDARPNLTPSVVNYAGTSRTLFTAPDSRSHRALSSAKTLPPDGGERVVARAAVVLGDVPFGGDEALAFQTVERGVERTLVDLQNIVGVLLDRAPGDAPAVHGTELRAP